MFGSLIDSTAKMADAYKKKLNPVIGLSACLCLCLCLCLSVSLSPSLPLSLPPSLSVLTTKQVPRHWSETSKRQRSTSRRAQPKPRTIWTRRTPSCSRRRQTPSKSDTTGPTNTDCVCSSGAGALACVPAPDAVQAHGAERRSALNGPEAPYQRCTESRSQQHLAVSALESAL